MTRQPRMETAMTAEHRVTLVPPETAPHAPTEIVGLTPASMPRLFELAVEKGGVEALERLVALHEKMQERQAAREYADAMAKFQAECPPIRKTSTAKVVTKSGGAYTYAYAELDEIARTVRPLLHKYGLAYSWDSELSPDGSLLSIMCTCSHVNGHKATATFKAPTEALTSGMSPQQRHAAALTYGRRQSLVALLGLTTCDADTDAAPEPPEASITPEQVDALEALIDKRPPGSRARLMEFLGEKFGCKSLDELPGSRFEWLREDLERKIAKQVAT